ncbi:class I SAM-dependent methyltransferase [bacterium]|nr:class I SAM-dependent methyltransferase [bacterium]
MNRNKLEKHRQIWNNRDLLQKIYKKWYSMILKDANNIDFGTSLEIGGGGGNLKECFPNIITGDIIPCSWLDLALDATKLPFRSNCIDNIVLIDVLHHLADPVLFFHEAWKILKPGGRILILEPYISMVSWLAYHFFHPEPVNFKIDYFSERINTKKDPWDANQAIASLLFYRELDRFNAEFSNLFKFIKKIKMSFLLYPLSGGFEKQQIIPDYLVNEVRFLEKMITPLSVFFAFRCYIVLEKLDQ